MKIKGTWIERPHKMAGTALCCTACGWKNLLETRCCPNCGAEMETEDGMVVVFELNDDSTYTRALHPLPHKQRGYPIKEGPTGETDAHEVIEDLVEEHLDHLVEKIHQLEEEINRVEKSYFTIESKLLSSQQPCTASRIRRK